MNTTWLLVAIGVLMFAHVALLAYAFRRASGRATVEAADQHTVSGSPRPVASGGERETSEPEDTAVPCPDCGELNEREFKYCRQCVTELPTGVSLARDSQQGQSRRTR